jgi:hypothetical protein
MFFNTNRKFCRTIATKKEAIHPSDRSVGKKKGGVLEQAG